MPLGALNDDSKNGLNVNVECHQDGADLLKRLPGHWPTKPKTR